MRDVRLFVCYVPKREGTLQIPIHLMERKSNTAYERRVYIWRLLSGGCSQQRPPVTLNWSNCLSSCDWGVLTPCMDSCCDYWWISHSSIYLFFLKKNKKQLSFVLKWSSPMFTLVWKDLLCHLFSAPSAFLHVLHRSRIKSERQVE